MISSCNWFQNWRFRRLQHTLVPSISDVTAEVRQRMTASVRLAKTILARTSCYQQDSSIGRSLWRSLLAHLIPQHFERRAFATLLCPTRIMEHRAVWMNSHWQRNSRCLKLVNKTACLRGLTIRTSQTKGQSCLSLLCRSSTKLCNFAGRSVLGHGKQSQQVQSEAVSRE